MYKDNISFITDLINEDNFKRPSYTKFDFYSHGVIITPDFLDIIFKLNRTEYRLLTFYLLNMSAVHIIKTDADYREKYKEYLRERQESIQDGAIRNAIHKLITLNILAKKGYCKYMVNPFIVYKTGATKNQRHDLLKTWLEITNQIITINE